MIFAFANNCDKICNHGYSNKGFWSFMIQSSGRVTSGTIKPDGAPDFFEIHGWFMWAGWGILGFFMLLSNRYLKRYWWLNMWIHIVAGVLIYACTMVLGLLAMEHLNWHIDNYPHTIFGFIILILTNFIVVGGIVARYSLLYFRWDTKKS